MFTHPEVTEIVASFPHGSVVLYLLRGDLNALIDTGTFTTPEKDIVPALQRLGMKLSDIDLVLNTHGHFDHTGGDSALKAAGAKIYIHPWEASQVNDRKTYVREIYGPLVTELLGKEYVTREWKEFVSIAGPEVAVDKLIEDNDVIDLGRGCRLRVLGLPGHTDGSVGFYWEKEGILFTGDALPCLHDVDGGLPIIIDLPAYQQTLTRLLKLPLKYLFNSHQMRCLSSPLSYKKQASDVQGFLLDSLEFTERIIEAVKAAPKLVRGEPAVTLYDSVIAQMPAKMGFKKSSEVPVIMFSTAVIVSALRQLKRYP